MPGRLFRELMFGSDKRIRSCRRDKDVEKYPLTKTFPRDLFEELHTTGREISCPPLLDYRIT